MVAARTLSALQQHILNDAIDTPGSPVMIRERMKSFWDHNLSWSRRQMGVMTGAQRVQLYRAWNDLMKRRLIRPVTIRGKKKDQHILTQKGYTLLCNANTAGKTRVTFKEYESRVASWIEQYKERFGPVKLDPEQKKYVELRRRDREVRREMRRKKKEQIEREQKKLRASVQKFQTAYGSKTIWLHFSSDDELKYLHKRLPNSRLIKKEIDRRKEQ